MYRVRYVVFTEQAAELSNLIEHLLHRVLDWIVIKQRLVRRANTSHYTGEDCLVRILVVLQPEAVVVVVRHRPLGTNSAHFSVESLATPRFSTANEAHDHVGPKHTRSRSPLLQGPAGPSGADTVEEADAEQEELRIGDVLGAVKRSFATVNAALTKQCGKVADTGRQVAAVISQTDALAVALEHRVSAQAADRAMLIKISKQLDEITQQLAAEEVQFTAPAPTEDPFAWVRPLQKDFLRLRKKNLSTLRWRGMCTSQWWTTTPHW